VSLTDGLTILDLKPGNIVKLNELRQIIKNSGYVSEEARVVVRGSLKELAARTVFEVAGTGEVLTIAQDPQHPEALGLLEAKPKQTVLEVSGTVDAPVPGLPRLLVNGVK
jgi:hypothetical protein